MSTPKEIKFDYLIIGGGIAGTTAAETIRAGDKLATIGIVSDEPYNLYSRVMLSKPDFFLEKIPFERVFLKSDTWYAEQKISLLVGKKAENLDIKKKSVRLNDGSEIQYNKLLLATGTCARRLSFLGPDRPGMYYVKDLEDAKTIIAAIKTTKRVVVVGGGFIGFEMCDLVVLAGYKATIVAREKHFWDPVLDKQSGDIIENALRRAGVDVQMSSNVKEIIGSEKVERVILDNDKKIDCEMLIGGIGAECDLGWLRKSGLQVGKGIFANEYLETNITNIWAAGDAAEYQDIILEETVMMGNWVNAQQQGKTAGLNMLGKKQPFRFVSFYTTQGLGVTIAFAGDVCPNKDGRKVITRAGPEKKSFGRLFVSYGELVGATFVNRTQEMGVVRQLIEKDIKVVGKEKELADPKFDLKKLLG
ncbi:MAG: hypothetical protein COT91_02045 [Candidatus Doudnabacteria bacterium CG10_big_fil_rev_8_21_14_0_10_41_10]|uniref:FAD/NAD(P)-binding domain-containing protein n=1 Tax=Candidatus Doudnabacteria bacterium CG10_big_fil_rev_8_21_14_0_10_41_10 TaxID=1974551 RepID=A0A2H0VDY8_9BACT|nr:MAG: hypothetical protein COT91_02045 [Candidatus Doudnabacteria bacterium CG10_big_fil_rev_8_21_14_0_10_41_10]